MAGSLLDGLAAGLQGLGGGMSGDSSAPAKAGSSGYQDFLSKMTNGGGPMASGPQMAGGPGGAGAAGGGADLSTLAMAAG